MVKTFTITSQPYYDQYNKCYKNILMVNVEPDGPFRQFVRKINLPKLSPFQQDGPCFNIPKCCLAVHGFKTNDYGCKGKGCNLTSPNEIPDLVTFLLSNGYQIESQLTNMFNQSEVKLTNSRLCFMATYYGQNQPNITYNR